MIDYRAHLVGLAAFEEELIAENSADPAIITAQNQQLADLDQQRGLAALGSLIDHLLRHAASNGEELDLLEKAASLWKQGSEMYTAIGSDRSAIEAALLDPAKPDSANRFNTATNDIRLWGVKVSEKKDAIQGLRLQIMKMGHIREHPRSLDLELSQWGWGDIFLARRTDAFVRTLYRLAQDQDQRAFAFGALSSYSANFCGSAYLEQVVGGPRRSHRFRDRLASNSVGSWFAQTNPAVSDLTALADLIRFGAVPTAPALPDAIEALIANSLRETYDLNRTGPLPDLKLGYSRLVRHLELLGGFSQLAPPADMATPFVVKRYGDPSNPPKPLLTLSTGPGLPGQGGGGGGGGATPTNYANSGNAPSVNDNGPTTGERCGSFWEGFVAALAFLGGGFAPCIGLWASGDRCIIWDEIWENWEDANRPSQAQMEALASQGQFLTSEEFEAAAGVEQLTTMVGYMFDTQEFLSSTLNSTLSFLAIHGLIYPDGMLQARVYKQFLTVPPPVTLPLRAEAEPVVNSYRYPQTAVEKPPFGWAPYSGGSLPSVFIGPQPPNSDIPTASRAALQFWLQIVRGNLDASNLDLDADRGFRFPCWTTQGSINSDPIGIQILGYEDI